MTNPFVSAEWSEWSLTQLRSPLQRGSLSATDAVRASLQNIAADSDLLAFISLRADLALAEAEAEDTSRTADSTPG